MDNSWATGISRFSHFKIDLVPRAWCVAKEKESKNSKKIIINKIEIKRQEDLIKEMQEDQRQIQREEEQRQAQRKEEKKQAQREEAQKQASQVQAELEQKPEDKKE